MEKYWRWLCFRNKITRSQQKKCMEYFKSPENMFIAASEEMEKLSFLSEEGKEELLRSRNEEELLREEKILEEKGISFYSCMNAQYPDNLRKIQDPPFGLFVKGILPKERKEYPKAVAIVGARWASHGGLTIARRTAKALSDAGIPVISGMASGIDGAAQEEALKGSGKSFGVLGCGVDICYPSSNRVLYRQLCEEGGLISEFPPGTSPAAWHFPMRNRIISGLADVVLVVEARKKSGSLITADFALEQGKDVYAVPGRIDDPLSAGCNRLISQGAGIFCSLLDFFENLGLTGGKNEIFRKKELILAKTENMVYSCVDFQGQNMESILLKTGLPREEAAKALLSLELMDLIEEKSRFYYRK